MEIIFKLFDLIGELYHGTPADEQWPMVFMLAFAGAMVFFADRWIKRFRSRRIRKKDPNIPQQLLDAKLLFSEHPIACRKPRPMHGQPDRVYQLDSGQKIPVDIKTRASQKVFQTDVIQLSVYALILNGDNMPTQGYIRFDSAKGLPVYKRVRLMSYAEVIEHYDHRQALIAGAVAPRGAKVKGQCTGCGHNPVCTTKP
jgi:CRISPR/Cas system-associated exonuclease Cas4 (RecB family)